MTHLRDAIVAFKDAQLLRGPVRLPHPQATELLVQSLGTPEARQGPPPTSFLEALRRRLLALYSESSQAEAERRDLRDAPWLLWTGKPRLATVPRLLHAVHVQAGEHQRTLRTLIEAWIAGFDPDDPTIDSSGRWIGSVLMADSDRRLDLWRGAHKRVALFDSTAGPEKLAAWLLSGPESVQQALAATGLDDPIRGGKEYAKAVQRRVQALAQPALRSIRADQALERASQFLATETGLRFPDLKGEMARDLTMPWRDRGLQPTESARGTVCDFLVKHLKDPRTNAGNWHAAGEETTNLLRGWLARASLDLFFDLIAEFALDDHWRWRKAFWKACMDRCGEKGIAFQAWVALGSRAHKRAAAARVLQGDFGQIGGPGVLPEHSVLLMCIGKVTLCDWSHNGALRAWPNDWRTAPQLYKRAAPQLYKREYKRSDLMEMCLDFPPNPTYGSRGQAGGRGLAHFGSARNYWQGSAAELLARHAGVQLTATDWRPQ